MRLAPGRIAGLGRSPRRGQDYQGTDRQCRGALLAVLRSSDEPSPLRRTGGAWPADSSASARLASLVSDGLVVAPGPGHLALPG